MKKSSEKKFMCDAIRNGSIGVLALGVVFGLATVRAGSPDSPPTTLGGAQSNEVVSTPSGEETFLPEENIFIESPVRPLYACCPSPFRTSKFTCDNTKRMTAAQCRASFGRSVLSCDQCPLPVDRVKGNPEEEVETMGDDSPVNEPIDGTPIELGSGSAWNLLAVTLFLASL